MSRTRKGCCSLVCDATRRATQIGTTQVALARLRTRAAEGGFHGQIRKKGRQGERRCTNGERQLRYGRSARRDEPEEGDRERSVSGARAGATCESQRDIVPEVLSDVARRRRKTSGRRRPAEEPAGKTVVGPGDDPRELSVIHRGVALGGARHPALFRPDVPPASRRATRRGRVLRRLERRPHANPIGRLGDRPYLEATAVADDFSVDAAGKGGLIDRSATFATS